MTGMDTISDTLLKLVNNPIDVFEDTCTVLIRIADNVLKDPSNLKVRSLNKTNQTVKRKILSVPGGVECLKLMGFQEDDQVFRLGLEAPLNKLEKVKTEIQKLNKKSTAVASTSVIKDETPKGQPDKCLGTVPKTKSVNTTAIKQSEIVPISQPDMIKKVKLPPFNSILSNSFLKEIEWSFHSALCYEDSDLQKRGKQVIPVAELESKASQNLRALQENIKRGKLKDPEIELQDMLILELLAWFKNEFFTWVDSPDCSFCGGKTKFSHISDDKKLFIHTDRVEMHKCNACDTLTPFPRYSDLNILLETRKGRCGEWAKTFTLLCRSMGWDARWVLDTTDHVWTEVFSHSQKRWLHCDPCENACDTPLMYEVGWKKSLSYVIAYSGEEVQDVTWRYSGDHKELLNRRKRCSEDELVKGLIKLRAERQKDFTKSRKDYLTKRLLYELVELMVEKKPSDKENQDRISGSLDWKLSRGEAHMDASKPVQSHTWIFSDADAELNELTLKYSSAIDAYELWKGTENVKTLKGWDCGVFGRKGVFRKVENDWKMAYICRQENAKEGELTWKFEIDEKCRKHFGEIELTLHKTTFEKAAVTASLTDSKLTAEINSDGTVQTLKNFSGSKRLVLTTNLLGEIGNNSWQHAQLFRESLDSQNYTFVVKFKLVDD